MGPNWKDFPKLRHLYENFWTFWKSWQWLGIQTKKQHPSNQNRPKYYLLYYWEDFWYRVGSGGFEEK